MRKPTETQAVWIFCSAVILLNVVGDCVWKMPDIIPNDAVALGVLVLSSFYCFVSIDVRRAAQRLRPSVPLVMSKGYERRRVSTILRQPAWEFSEFLPLSLAALVG